MRNTLVKRPIDRKKTPLVFTYQKQTPHAIREKTSQKKYEHQNPNFYMRATRVPLLQKIDVHLTEGDMQPDPNFNGHPTKAFRLALQYAIHQRYNRRLDDNNDSVSIMDMVSVGKIIASGSFGAVFTLMQSGYQMGVAKIGEYGDITYELQMYQKLKEDIPKKIFDSHFIKIDTQNTLPLIVTNLTDRSSNVQIKYGAYVMETGFITLSDVIKKYNHHIHTEQRWCILRAIASTLETMHNLKYAFCDLKAQNLILSPLGTIKFIDFGGVTPFGTRCNITSILPHNGSACQRKLILGIHGPCVDIFTMGKLILYIWESAPLSEARTHALGVGTRVCRHAESEAGPVTWHGLRKILGHDGNQLFSGNRVRCTRSNRAAMQKILHREIDDSTVIISD
jgi:Protein kinase domain